MARDSQKSRLYAAEREHLTHYTRTLTIEECNDWLARLQTEEWFKARFGTRKVTARKAHGNAHTSYGWHGGGMELARWGRNLGIVVHELAHCLGGGGEVAHGPEFCGRYATLVFHVFGREAEEKLLKGYAEQKIKHSY